jgi:hypothetical protein
VSSSVLIRILDIYNIWEYVYDPITKTYITINDNFGNATSTDLPREDVGYAFLTHPTSGLQAVLSGTVTDTRAHSFPSLAHQTTWSVTHPTQAGWVKADDILTPTDTAYGFFNRTTTSVEIFKYTIDIAGTVSRVSIGTFTTADFPPSVSTIAQLSDRPIPHYDAATDSITAQFNTQPGFVHYVVNYDVTGETVNWVTEVNWTSNNFGYPRQYALLDGGYWAFFGNGGLIYTLVNLVTGDAEDRWSGSNFAKDNSAFWDDRSDTMFAISDDNVVEQFLIKTQYVAVTIAPGTLELFLSLPFPIEAGDLFTLYPGCDKSRITCAAIFDNVTKMLGAPDVPGQDALFSYPDVK